MYEVTIYGRTGCPHCFFTERKMQDVKDAMVTIIHDNQQVRDIAKEYNTKQQSIYDENSLAQDILDSAKMLLIPTV